MSEFDSFRIFYTEDDPDYGLIFKEALNDTTINGRQVNILLHAQSLPQAQSMIRGDEFDHFRINLAILDARLSRNAPPSADALLLIDEIRLRYPSVLIIAFTNDTVPTANIQITKREGIAALAEAIANI